MSGEDFWGRKTAWRKAILWAAQQYLLLFTERLLCLGQNLNILWQAGCKSSLLESLSVALQTAERSSPSSLGQEDPSSASPAGGAALTQGPPSKAFLLSSCDMRLPSAETWPKGTSGDASTFPLPTIGKLLQGAWVRWITDVATGRWGEC